MKHQQLTKLKSEKIVISNWFHLTIIGGTLPNEQFRPLKIISKQFSLAWQTISQ
jgi:hypothetical protein